MLSITKGLVDLPDGTLISYLEYYRRQLGGRKLSLNAIGGPCTAYELADLDPTTVCFCGQDIALLRKLRAMLRTEYYHITVSTDVEGLECAVALKNAFALGVALAVGLAKSGRPGGKLHYNSQAALFGQSVKEMRRILKAVGRARGQHHLWRGRPVCDDIRRADAHDRHAAGPRVCALKRRWRNCTASRWNRWS